MRKGDDEEQPHVTRAERGQQTRARLIEATIMSIAHDGVAGALVTRIASLAGVSQGLIRHYFGSKSRLIAEAFSQLTDEMRELLGMGSGTARDKGCSARERLDSVVVRSFETLRGIHERQYAWFGFWALARSDDDLARINSELYAETVHHLGKLAADVAAEQGADIDVDAAGRRLASLLDGTWLHLTIGIEGYSRREAELICLEYVSQLLDD